MASWSPRRPRGRALRARTTVESKYAAARARELAAFALTTGRSTTAPTSTANASATAVTSSEYRRISSIDCSYPTRGHGLPDVCPTRVSWSDARVPLLPDHRLDHGDPSASRGRPATPPHDRAEGCCDWLPRPSDDRRPHTERLRALGYGRDGGRTAPLRSRRQRAPPGARRDSGRGGRFAARQSGLRPCLGREGQFAPVDQDS